MVAKGFGELSATQAHGFLLLRCLAEGAGDVAFVKHSTVLENTDGEWEGLASGTGKGSWVSAVEFKLLCRQAGQVSSSDLPGFVHGAGFPLHLKIGFCF